MLRIETTDEQNLMVDTAHRYLRERYSFDARQKVLASAAGRDDRVWKDFAEMGWLSLPIPEPHGAGGNLFDLALLMETFGAALVVEPYLPTVVLAGTALSAGGSEAQKAEFLPAIAEGRARMAVAFAERHSGYDHFDIETVAARDGGGYRITGAKSVVLGAPDADHLVVTARLDGRPGRDAVALFLVPRQCPGLAMRDYVTIDGRRAAEVHLADVAVPEAARLGEEGGGADLLDRVVLSGTVAVLGETAGLAEAAVRLTADYLNTREQFDRKLSSFQALQHRVAHLFVLKEELRAICRFAARSAAVDPDGEGTREAISAAKALAGESGRKICEETVQLHGAIAITDEYVAGHYLKRMVALDHLFGNASHHFDRFVDIVRDLRPDGAAGAAGS